MKKLFGLMSVALLLVCTVQVKANDHKVDNVDNLEIAEVDWAMEIVSLEKEKVSADLVTGIVYQYVNVDNNIKIGEMEKSILDNPLMITGNFKYHVDDWLEEPLNEPQAYKHYYRESIKHNRTDWYNGWYKDSIPIHNYLY